jgi:hypothetical protein
MREGKDRSSKWLLEHHGDSVLRLSGVTGFLSWCSVRSELTHPRQLPDGLLEATFPGQAEPALYVVEVATYPERRAEEEARNIQSMLIRNSYAIGSIIWFVAGYMLSPYWRSSELRGPNP